MKFCYIDESGTGGERYAVMVGIVADAHRMKVTKQYWDAFREELAGLVGHHVQEIHAVPFYRGIGPWRHIPGPERRKLEITVFQWLNDRRHGIAYSCVDTAQYGTEFKNEAHKDEITSVWMMLAIHLCLSLQKHHQREEKNK